MKCDPLVLELLRHRLARSFVEQYAEFATGEEKSTEDKLAVMSNSVMSLTGGANSPFERRRASVVKELNVELEEVHAPAIATTVAATLRARDKAEQLAVSEHLRLEKSDIRVVANGAPMAMSPEEEKNFRATNDGHGVKFRLCFRPFRRYRMGTGILCQAGEALGNTFRGHKDFQMTDNIIAKTHIGHYTMWHKAVVVDDRRLYLAEDMFCSGYVGGEGHASVGKRPTTFVPSRYTWHECGNIRIPKIGRL